MGEFGVYLTLLSDVDPGETREELQGREAGVEVGLPGGDEPVADQVGGSHEQGVGWVCREQSWGKIIQRKFSNENNFLPEELSCSERMSWSSLDKLV